jgi:hypothetical protein
VLDKRKADNPLDKKLMSRKSSDSFSISNRKSKPSSEAVQENYRQEQTGECSGLHAFSLQT